MAGVKSAKDPFKEIRAKVPKLQKHLQLMQDRLKANEVPKKHSSRVAEHHAWMRLEISRTQNKIAELKLLLPGSEQ